MKRTALNLLCLAVAVVASCTAAAQSPGPVPASPRVTQSFDPDWRFLKADAPGAEQPAFDDSAWRKLDVPHDWSIEGPFSQTNPSTGRGAWLPSGIGWYRKHFTLPDDFKSRCIFIEFDGIMQNSDVWINGFKLGHRPYGYVSFQYEMTGHLNFGGADNVLAVRADTSAQPASRYYLGAGIYRHVRLVATDPVHIVHWGEYVTTPQVSAAQATVHVQTTVTNQSGGRRLISVQVSLFDPDGKEAGQSGPSGDLLAEGTSARFDQDVVVRNPQLWDLDKPLLYSARETVKWVSTLVSGPLGTAESKFPPATAIDEMVVPFGIREAVFKPDTGFWLNGKNIKIKGVCLHQDGGAFGIAVPDGVWEQRFLALKQIGANAIRTAHNPPDPAFLDLCDRMGFLVMDEMFDCWTVGKYNDKDYHLFFNEWSQIDTRVTVLRDRNHPSIILYSAGNEIHDTPNAPLATNILAGLVKVFHANDPSRPVTQALFRPNASHDYDDGLADMLDVIGTNYRDEELLAAHNSKPSRKIIGTENTHAAASWVSVRDNPAYSGQFLWTGIDYLGETTAWPSNTADFGLLDRAGELKPRACERESWWSEKPVVFIARAGTLNWTPASTAPHRETVDVYSNCREVELFLNGKSLGSKTIADSTRHPVWQVDFEPGAIRAVAKNGGVAVANNELRTAGAATRIQLTANASVLPADYAHVCRVLASVVDAHGVTVPTASPVITFAISGPGVIAAVDNSDNSSPDPFQASSRKAAQGRCVAFIKAAAPSGTITLTASAPGLSPASLSIPAAQ